MAYYHYKAKKGAGESFEGEMVAGSENEVLHILEKQGITPIWVREVSDNVKHRKSVVYSKKISYSDITVFSRQLASLLRSGIPILKALNTVKGQVSNALGTVINDIYTWVMDGNMLSGILEKYPKLFNGFYISMIKAGETSGSLDKMLLRIAEAREKEEEIRRKVKAAIAYPILVLVVGFATVFFLLTFFMPRIMKLFEDFNDLPLPTRILINISGFFHKTWYLQLLIVVMIFLVIHRIISFKAGRIRFDELVLRIPLIGPFILRHDIVRFSRTLSLLVDAGIGIEKAINMSASTMQNTFLRSKILEASSSTISNGYRFSGGLKRYDCFPNMMINMISVGEESGSLDESLMEIANFYEQELEQRSRLMTSLIEPVLILVVGTIVGFIVAAMLLPIFKLSSGFGF